MIRAFWKSKLAVGAVMVVCLGLAVAVWLRDREYPVYIPAIASLLLLGIGYFAGRLLGNLVAGTQNTRCLGLLHLDLDPQAFLAYYKQIPGRLNPNSRDFPIASACLADGYAAAGEFDQAIETLCGAFRNVKKGDQALRALYYNNLCGYALSKEDLVLARQAEQKLELAGGTAPAVNLPDAAAGPSPASGHVVPAERQKTGCTGLSAASAAGGGENLVRFLGCRAAAGF